LSQLNDEDIGEKSMGELKGSVVIVSGAGGGLGRALAIALGAAGANVIGVGRRARHIETLEAEVAAAGGRAIGYCADVRDDDSMREVVNIALREFGHVDILVNNAAVMYLAPMADVEVDDWHEMVDVNIKAPLTLIGAVLPGMLARRSGHIVNISSISARKVGPGVTVYSATKGALDTVSEGLRQEVAAKGVRVTSFQLGAVATELNNKIRNVSMRRLIKTRATAYHALAVDDVVKAIVHVLQLPPNVNMGSAFLAPADQAG
jgi:NADP-dependent 3-hydroxy acid dehydrogenase YdfG